MSEYAALNRDKIVSVSLLTLIIGAMVFNVFIKSNFEFKVFGFKFPKPISWEQYQERGSANMEQHNYSAAIKEFTKAIKRGPKNLALYYLRGSSLAQINKHAAAIKDFKIILAVDPNNVTVKALLENSENKLMEESLIYKLKLFIKGIVLRQ